MRSWKSHLGNEATPKALVEIITKNQNNLAHANNLKDLIKEEFNLS